MLDIPTIPPAQPSLLLVDDDINVIQVMARALAPLARLRFATSGHDALRLAREEIPDMVLLDAEMPHMSGFQVCEALRQDSLLAEVPVIFVTAHTEEEVETAGLALGAVDFITKPIRSAILVARVTNHLRFKQARDELKRLAYLDGLTAVPNRRVFDERLQWEWQRAARVNAALSLLMVDVDYFKAYNDNYGHAQGDAVLKAVAQAIAGVVKRPGDLVARYGGEEFVVLLGDAGRDGAQQVAQAMQQAIATLAIAHEASGVAPHVSVSIGGACIDAGPPATAAAPAAPAHQAQQVGAAEQLLQVADRALYQAKHAGRARAVLLSCERLP